MPRGVYERKKKAPAKAALRSKPVIVSVPRDLHDKLKQRAENERRTITTVLSMALEEYLGEGGS